MRIHYLTLDEAKETHEKTINVSGGGTLGHLDLGKLDGVLEHIQNDDYYPTFEKKLTHLFFSACKFHCFQDGNKRIAITLSTQMLLANGYLYCSQRFLREMENISYHVAAGNIDKDLLYKAICSCLYEPEQSEELKLEILNAISERELNDGE